MPDGEPEFRRARRDRRAGPVQRTADPCASQRLGLSLPAPAARLVLCGVAENLAARRGRPHARQWVTKQIRRSRRQRDRLRPRLSDAAVRPQALHGHAGLLVRPIRQAGPRHLCGARVDRPDGYGWRRHRGPSRRHGGRRGGPAGGLGGRRSGHPARRLRPRPSGFGASSGDRRMSAARTLPDGPLLTFYGDDFTGSSAVMEVTAFAGLPTVLFLTPPTPEPLAQFADRRAIGIAGIARSQSPEWMDRNLPPVFELLRSLGAPITHYKVCSTFDSAPHVGSIGRAIDLGAPILGGAWEPVVVGDPGMGRYQAFGCLFAVVNGVGYPLDEHPVMSRHPITPMDDANLGRHLAKQTAREIGLIDFVAMKKGEADARLASALSAGTEIVFLDVLDRETFAEAGRLIWENRGERLFGIGSQGFEAALVAYWRSAGLIPAEPEDSL